MKKSVILAMVGGIMVLVASVALAIYGEGWGKILTATTTPQEVSGFTANKVSIYNPESTNATVYCLANCATGTLAAAILGNTAIPIPGGTAWTFDCNGKQSIDRICIQVASGSVQVFIGAY